MQLDWTSIFVQIPVIAAFIWFAKQVLQSFLAALDARDAKYEERNQALLLAFNAMTGQITALTAQISQLTTQTASHDGWTKEAVALMVERAELRNAGAVVNTKPKAASE